MSEHDANAEMGRLERELEEARERLSDLSRTGGETKLASSTGPRPMLAMVPQEQWDAIRERLASTERERDVLQLQLDAIRGLATGQPGSDPSSSDQGWSPALCAVKALVRERDEARDEAERLAKKGDVYREAWHVIESALDGAGGLSPKHSPEEARDFIVRVIRERDRWREYVERLEAALREHAEAITAHRNAVAIDESAMLDCRRSVDTYGNRLATRARVKETQATLLALGREIQGRKP